MKLSAFAIIPWCSAFPLKTFHCSGQNDCAQRFRASPTAFLQATDVANDDVCISIAAYEESQWLDVLADNVLKFAEPSTKVVFHLNADSNYTADEIQSLTKRSPGRIAVSEERIAAHGYRGSLQWTFIINARTANQVWPNKCSYFLWQASNMMWVRRGFEKEVRKHHYSYFHTVTEEEMKHAYHGGVMKLPFVDDLMAPRRTYGHVFPEASYYPMSTVQDFDAFLTRRIERDWHGDYEKLFQWEAWIEAYMLPTYVLNYENDQYLNLVGEGADSARSLCYAYINYQIPAEKDYCPLNEVKKVSDGGPGWDRYYAVKRVARDLSHPTTEFIVNLESAL